MLLWIMLLHELVSGVVDGGASSGTAGVGISCACSTTQCLAHGLERCNTTGMCFSQYLERPDGSHPVVRGCIATKTPLLCENRRPAVAGPAPWPTLLCCSSDLCNRDAVPTPRPADSDRSTSRGSDTTPSPAANGTAAASPPWPRIVSPVTISVLVLGALSLAALGAAAAAVLRRGGERYGALGPKHAPGADNPVGVRCECERPFVHVVCDGRPAPPTDDT